MTSLDLPANVQAARRDERLSQWTRVLCVLFFLSGFPALIYQLTWQRSLFLVFGVNIESVTIVVTAFMLGLGLGSLAGGWLSKRPNVPPLPLLAAIELLTAAFGAVSLTIFDKAGGWMTGLSLPSTAVVSLALVLVPTLLMGATLPVLVGHLVRRSGNVGSAVGLLYYVNTLGAGAACLACAVLLFPFFGMSGSVYVAVAMNVAVALGALAAHGLDSRQAQPALPAAASGRKHGPVVGRATALALAATGGFVSLSYEIFFFRTISYASGSSATAFAVVLSAFLVGIASGSRKAGEDCETLPREALMRRLVNLLMIASVAGILFLPVLSHLAWIGDGIVGIAVLMVYLVARFWGALLPCLAEVSIASDSRAGMGTATLYLANILGSAAGSVITGFVLMDRFGLVTIGTALVVGGIATIMVLIAVLGIPVAERRRRLAMAAALALVAAGAVPALSGQLLENLQWKGAPNAERFTKVIENRSGIITVTGQGVVYGHGMYDGRFNTDIMHDTNGIVRPYALSLFHPAPRDVLMVGLSSGSWAQVVANNPDVASLTIIEINPGYVTLIEREPQVAPLLNNPKVTIVNDDGRRWLRANPDRRFDAIISNTTWYFRASVTNLLSVEFLDLVRHHLNSNGIFFYNTTDSDRVQRTGCLAFSYGARFTNHMVLSDTPIAWDFQRWRHVLASYRLDGRAIYDPARAEDRAELDKLAAWQENLAPNTVRDRKQPIEPCSHVVERTAGMKPVTDDNMGSEWLHFLGFE